MNRLGLLAVLLAFGAHATPLPVDEFTTFTQLAASPLKRLPEREAWKKAAPDVREVLISSSADGTKQPSLFFAADANEPRPLLVVLHSWSVDYLDHASIPYGVWAMRNGWNFIHPQYRGRFDGPEATGSELAVSDILDAVEYAKSHAQVDGARVYLVGFSGGGMMALSMAGRHPELWAAVVAWVPVFDLVEWHRETRNKYKRYARDIRRSCGGVPAPGTAAEKECLSRSPSTYLAGALGSGVPVYIAAGIDDPFVSPRHALSAFNVLANEKDRFTEQQIARLSETRTLPPELAGPVENHLYQSVGRPLLLQRTSASVALLLFKGRHDVIYNAGLFWLARQHRGAVPD